MSRPATSRLKVNPPLGSKPALRWLRLDEMFVDRAYQRSLEAGQSQTLVRKIATYWDWNLCQPLTVARRPNGAMMIVDGQHRHAAAQLRGDIETLPCVVSNYENTGDEAAAFVAMNQQRRPLTAIDLFQAALAAGDANAREVEALLKDAGLTVARHTNFTCWSPGMVSNIGGIQRALRVYGREVTDTALRSMADAFYGQVLRYSGTIFAGLVRFIAEELAEVRPVFLVQALKEAGQKELVRASLNMQAEDGCRRDLAMRRVIERAYIRALPQLAADVGLREERLPVVPAPFAVPQPPPLSGSRWCDQCDMRVSAAQATSCKSPFCKAKAAA